MRQLGNRGWDVVSSLRVELCLLYDLCVYIYTVPATMARYSSAYSWMNRRPLKATARNDN